MRLFIAIDIDEKLKIIVADIQRNLQKQINPKIGRFNWVEPGKMHLTLKFLGEVEQEKVPLICETVAEAVKNHKSFSFGISAVGFFGRPVKVIWLGSAEKNQNLVRLHKDIEDALDTEGWPRENRAFSPHLTLARIKDITKDRKLKDTIKNHKPVSSAAVRADSVKVYKSVLTPEGAVYTVLGETKLK